MNINGREFTVVKGKKAQDIIDSYNSRWLKTWSELYRRPSSEKTEIMMDWERFFIEIDAYPRMYRGNSSTFSILSRTEDKYFCITKGYNYVVLR